MLLLQRARRESGAGVTSLKIATVGRCRAKRQNQRSISYAVFSHFFTSASISLSDVISIRYVMRSFLAKPPVFISRLGAFVSLSARPRSIRVRVVGLICAK